MDPKRKERIFAACKRVEVLMAGGMSQNVACAETNTSPITFKKYRAGVYGNTPASAPKAIKHRFVDLEAAPSAATVAVIVCTPEQLANVLRGLK